MTTQGEIHPQLLEDCHLLGTVASGVLLLHRNASLPWFILVPETELTDVLDLEPARREAVFAEAAAVSGYIKGELGWPKVNVAGLGNQVPQMHLHVIGRRVGDAAWPQPVWGNLPPGPGYDAGQLAALRAGLSRCCGLRPAGGGEPPVGAP